MAPETDTIVVVGGGLASARFATEYRAAGGEAPVTILSSEEDPPYHRPPLTKGFLRGEVERDGTYVRPAEEYEDDIIELRLNVVAERIDPEKRVVVLEGGEEVPYGTLAKDAGAEVDNGIVVDERFRASLPDVYAIGDVARYPDPTSGRLRRIEHWSSANAQGGHLGRQLAGSKEPYDELPVFFTQLFDLKFQVIGDPESATETVVRGSLADGRLVGFHLTDDGQLVGAVVHGESADVVEELKTLVRERPVIDDPARLTDENVRPAEAVGA
jgi:NADPH-dependent 2,4-dienoyl-CoA reductase/sulfur reductase-like enzyme